MKEKTLKLKCDVSLLNEKVVKYVDNELEKFCEHNTTNNTMEVISEHIIAQLIVILIKIHLDIVES